MATGINKLTVQEATNQIAQRKVIRVIPTIETAEYESGDVIFNSVAIPNAVMREGGCSKLIDADIRTAKVLASWACEAVDDTTEHLDNSEIKRIFDTRSANGNTVPSVDPTLLQAAEGSRDVYFAVLGGSTITYGGTTDLEFIFHIEY